MAERTFVPTLIRMVKQLCVYMTRYGNIIRENLPPAAQEPFSELQAACSALLENVTIDVNP